MTAAGSRRLGEADPVEHPHDLRAGVPHRLPAAVVRELSKIDPWRVFTAITAEWAVIGVTIAVASLIGWPAYPLAVVVIGARQAALTVIAHDAVHGRLLASRGWNDAIADAFVGWPTFITLAAFRKHHGEHHQHLGETEDGNRFIWRTHDRDGALRDDWVYPKSVGGLAWVLAKKSAGPTGLFWMLRGTLAPIVFPGPPGELTARVVYTAAIAGILTVTHTWTGFLLYWIVPFCTWHMFAQYVRLVCEHSAVPRGPSSPPAYGLTRTTLATAWERWLLVPRNIHYHLEHHFYPSVPFYNLPALHAALMAESGYRENAVVTSSVVASLRGVLTPATAP
jgi:fatty acid desaturase